jgi:hypothetical protein
MHEKALSAGKYRSISEEKCAMSDSDVANHTGYIGEI